VWWSPRALPATLQEDPDNAEYRVFYGHLLVILGRYVEAVAHGEQARRDDPLNPSLRRADSTIVCPAVS
jgi:hypothetical protein